MMHFPSKPIYTTMICHQTTHGSYQHKALIVEPDYRWALYQYLIDIVI